MIIKTVNKSGAVPLLLVMMLSIFMVLAAVIWQSKLLLSIYRNQVMADSLILTYDAESRIYGLISLFLNGFANAFDFSTSKTETLADGTVLQITGSQDGREQTLVVLAKRRYGTTRLEVVREDLSLSSETLDDTEIMLILDCSTTNMTDQIDIASEFIKRIDEITGGRMRLGVSVFALKSDWLYTSYNEDGTPDGDPLTFDSNADKDEILEAIDNGLGDSDKPACKSLLTGTNIGSGLAFTHSYMHNQTGPGKKQIEVLITDGRPNQRTEYTACPISLFCPIEEIYCYPNSGYVDDCPVGSGIENCRPYARDYLRCAMADTSDVWEQEKPDDADPEELNGIRDPNVSLFTLTLSDEITDTERDIYEKYGSGYQDLSGGIGTIEAVENIIQQITNTNVSYEIRKIRPE